MTEDIPLDVALSSVLAAAIDHGERQALLMALHRQPSTEATEAAGTPDEPPAPADGDETTPSKRATAARRLVAVPAPRPDPEPSPDGEARGDAVVLAFTPRREWEPEDPPPAA